jgi:hypothetical protein
MAADTLRVAAAKLQDELQRRNQEALLRLGLKPGDRVCIRKAHDLDGQHYEWADEHTVSSIDERGRLYFKGGGGMGAWASQVEKLVLGGSRPPADPALLVPGC